MLEAGMKAPEFALPDRERKGTHIGRIQREESRSYVFIRETTLRDVQNRHVVSENYILNFQKKERLCLE